MLKVEPEVEEVFFSDKGIKEKAKKLTQVLQETEEEGVLEGDVP